ncbi:recombinase family protein [Paenibacillus sp. WQ 127069]|uniref:Recombinase family protein n=1 Tax=Paenibacillus baimaensis TaxID=2982185 RepID=A0ABT2UV95_9BACL|nr:recombinase family protein [Paenibacillus sp. WQ 127069]MCU6798036.1 recombinase family protein [Paenibacillus sp. WQ 127069]
MKVAIYARTSTELQSTASQIELCREYAMEQGWTITGIYDDPGISEDTKERDGLKLFATECMKYDILMITGADRLFQDPALTEKFLNDLGNPFIQIVIVKQLTK